MPAPKDLDPLLFPQWLEYAALHSPEHPIFVHETALGSGELRTITWSSAYSSFTKAAAYMTSYVGSFAEPPVVGVLGNIDTTTFYSFVCGIWLTGAIPFLISTRNSPAAVAHLISSTNASALFVSSDESMQTLAAAALKRLGSDGSAPSPIEVFPAPQYHDLYRGVDDDGSAPHQRLALPAAVTLDSPAIILHSSGSTAFPKPITLTQRMLREWASWPLDSDSNKDSLGYRTGIHALPVFHSGAVIWFCLAINSGMTLSTFPPTQPPVIPSPDKFLASLVATNSDAVVSVPHFLEVWSESSRDVEILKGFKLIAFGSGPLGREVGDYLVEQGVKLVNCYGSTELGLIVPFLYAPYADWEMVTLARRLRFHFRPIEGSKDEFELIVLQTPECTPAVLNTEVDGVKGFATNDVVTRHQTDSYKVRMVGRVDDQLMLSTGEKTNPGPLEAIITRNPRVRAAIMFGRGRHHNGVIIQPIEVIEKDDTEATSSFVDGVWQSFEAANAFAPTHSRILKEMVIVANPAKPFRYTPKHSIIRKATLDDYKGEIEAAYRGMELAQKKVAGPTDWSSVGVHEFVQRAVSKLLDREVGENDDIFLKGADSLGATYIRNVFLHALRDSPHAAHIDAIGQGFVYTYPTVSQLAAALYAVVSAESSATSSSTHFVQQRVEQMEALISEFTSNFPAHYPDRAKFRGPTSGDSEILLITGTTGALGAQLLSTLASSPVAEKIYALNRASERKSLYERQREALVERGLNSDILDTGKVVLLEGDTEKVRFDLPADLYDELRDMVTLIIHNAWRVNFVLQVASFKPLLKGTRNIIDFALASAGEKPPRILFTSSVGVFSSALLTWNSIDWDSAEAPVEGPIPPQSAVGNGYSESKYVAERILHAASEVTPIHTISIRVGQLTGTEAGAWNSTDWVPAIVRSGQVLGVLPDHKDSVAWLSLRLAAETIFDFRTAPSSVTHLNLSHPSPTPWSSVFLAFSCHINSPVIPWNDWLEQLEKASASSSGDAKASRNPALMLIPFFQASKARSTANDLVGGEKSRTEAPGNIYLSSLNKALSSSVSLRRAAEQPMDVGAEVRKWVSHWKKTGLLD